jgi:SAM-dependent methyltransferase
MGKFVYPVGAWYLAKLQLEQIGYYEEGAWLYLDAVEKYLKYHEKVLDLGCGLGRNTVVFSRYMDAHFILADSNGDTVKSGWRGDKKEYYNDLRLTEAFVRMNGVEDFEIFDLEKKWNFKDIDLVYSFISVGFHFPIKPYEKRLLESTTDDCVFIFSIRGSKYDKAVGGFDNHFKNKAYINSPFPGWPKGKEMLLILWDKK